MAKKEMVQEEFENTSKAKIIDDDGYEEGKSKEREMVADISGKDKLSDYLTKGGKIYSGKAKDYPGIKNILRDQKSPVIPIKLGPGGGKKS